MKKLVVVLAAMFAVAAVVRAIVRMSGAGFGRRLEAAMEACPPIARMSRLEAQNEEVIGLLRQQNELLRRETAGLAV